MKRGVKADPEGSLTDSSRQCQPPPGMLWYLYLWCLRDERGYDKVTPGRFGSPFDPYFG